MPVRIPKLMPVGAALEREGILVIHSGVDNGYLLRPANTLRVAIVNLMPLKQATELQLLRLLGNTPYTVDVTFLRMESHISKNTASEHLDAFYTVFSKIRTERFDGVIITGAPIEKLPFEEVGYWPELCEVMDWSAEHAAGVFYICWGAQAALYHHYRVPKYPMPEKMFGVFSHTINNPCSEILRGFDDVFFAPHSRHTELKREDILAVEQLELLSESETAGVYIVGAKNKKLFFVTGHSEYDPHTLREEYERDIRRGDKIDVPVNYFPNGDPTKPPLVTWRAHANLLFGNWLRLIAE